MEGSVKNGKCPFCKEPARFWSTRPTLHGFDCAICGQFFVSGELHEALTKIELGPELLNCISENIVSNTPTGKFPIITSWHLAREARPENLAADITVKRFEDFASLPIIHSDKPEALLMLAAAKVEMAGPFSETTLTFRDLYQLKINGVKELHEWRKVLEESNLLLSRIDLMPEGLHSISFRVSPAGWERVFSKRRSVNSKKVFIAMQFSWGEALTETKTFFIEAIKLGCKDCGYEAELVSDQHHLDQITDRIVAKIKSARFVIADFTFNNRGSYYEAGLARGLGIPVIHTVMKGHTADPSDKEKRLHFDIQQINYLEWSNPAEVRERLRDRIMAVIER